MCAPPQIKIHKNQKIIKFLVCFSRNRLKLSCFVPLLAFCELTYKKKSELLHRMESLQILMSVLRYRHIMGFCDASDA